MSTYDKASLVLIPSGTKEGVVFSQKPTNGDGDFTFTRASSATRVNSDGLIEKERGNTTIYSQDANNWSSPEATRDSATESDPFGGTSAGQYTATGFGAGYVYVTSPPSWSSGQVVTGSVYVKDIDSTYVQLIFGTAAFGSGQYQNFDLSSGTKGTGAGLIDSTITSVGGGWYRLSITAQAIASAASGLVIIFVPSASAIRLQTPNAGQTLQIFGIQTELGLVATDYIETTTTAVYGGITDNIPRLDYTDASCPSLLLEPQRTNLVTQSEYIASWQLIGSITATSNYANSPEGVQNSTRLQFSGASQEARLALSSVTGCMASVYVKGTNNETIKFGTTSSEELFTLNGSWQRIEKYNAGSPSHITINTYSGATARDIEVWGAQVEEASYVTSYIPTYGASVTKLQDECSVTGVSDLIGQTEGTAYVEFMFNNKGDAGVDASFFAMKNSSGSSYLNIFRLNTTLAFRFFDNSSNQFFHTETPANETLLKVAFAYKENDFALYVNGVQEAIDTSGSVGAMSQIHLAGFSVGDNITDNYKTMLFKTRLSNEELADLTTI